MYAKSLNASESEVKNFKLIFHIETLDENMYTYSADDTPPDSSNSDEANHVTTSSTRIVVLVFGCSGAKRAYASKGGTSCAPRVTTQIT